MQIAIRYQSRGGSTRKVAEAMANSLKLEAHTLETALPEEGVDLLFLGGGIYAGKFDAQFNAFLSQLTRAKARRVVLFCTSMAKHDPLPVLARASLRDREVQLGEDFFSCRGKFLFVHRSRPDEKDLARAADFALATVTQKA